MKRIAKFVIGLIALALIVTVIFYIYYMHSSYHVNDTIFSGYISGFGSFLGGVLGGIIGAIVAYSIVRIQNKMDKANIRNQEKIKYANILRALITELKHNQNIISIIIKSENKESNDYIDLLETEIWNRIKFDANNFLLTDLFNITDTMYREFKDMKAKILEEYKTEKVDFQLRYKSIGVLIDKLQKCLDDVNDEIKKYLDE